MTIVRAAALAAASFLVLLGCERTFETADRILLGADEVPQVIATPAQERRNRPVYERLGPPPLDVEKLNRNLPVAVGDVGPIADGERQYPFACETAQSNLGQPLVDNQDGIGTPVFLVEDGERTDRVIGYSKDCLIKTRIELFYRSTSDLSLKPLPAGDDLPRDIAHVTLDGQRRPFVVRVERGSLNRFIYAIGVLVDPRQPDTQLWNGRLILYVRGGVGIGKRQGQVKANNAFRGRLEDLAKGYMVAFTSGAHSRNHLDPHRAAATLAMVKAQLIARYGQPRATFAVAESGGAALSYLIAENYPGIVDGVVGVYAFPDFVTHTTWALDCELLEYYFDVTAADQPRWRDQTQRTLINGLAGDNDAFNRYDWMDGFARVFSLREPRGEDGGNACSLGWRGLAPRAFNPRFYDDAHLFAHSVLETTDWSHWDDLVHVYGTDSHGFAHRTFDNEGVQYGLAALKTGAISPQEFLHLNAFVGGWKAPHEFEQERYWILADRRDLESVSIWSDHNMLKAPAVVPLGKLENIMPAPRTRAYLPAVRAAERAGQTFTGSITVPVIDVRHYTDPELDIHHSFASLAARERIRRHGGDPGQFAIWTAEEPFDPVAPAIAALDEWLTFGRRPNSAEDRCVGSNGEVIAAGPGVWDSAYNGKADGACTRRHPPYRSSRSVAGAPMTGEVFKCDLTPASEAIDAGVYEPVNMRPFRTVLTTIFPTGVCRYADP